ncbi:MAG: hypothetical protein HC945_03515 [Nitrosarchaeum sp.]|nr:hypothetical protein [Nitrosarchaeum sp.]
MHTTSNSPTTDVTLPPKPTKPSRVEEGRDERARPAKGTPEEDPDPRMLEEEHTSLTSNTEDIEKRFDKRISAIQDRLAPEKTKDAEKSEDEIQAQLEELSQQISNLRKEGKDAFIPSVTLRLARSRFAVSKATQEQRDYAAVHSLLQEVRTEIEEVRNEEELSIKAEVERLARGS